jgi:hypothetical protein
MHGDMRVKFQRISSWLVTSLTVSAAVWLGFYSFVVISDPLKTTAFRHCSFEKPDSFNVQLDLAQKILAPINRDLPSQAPLRYLSQPEDDNYRLDYMQAVLAPRRIGPDVDSQYLFVYAETKEWLASRPELRNARLLGRFPPLGDIYLRKASP